MAREPNIPIFLWIATALLVHLTGGEGAQRAADILGERMDVQRFADSVRRHVQSSNRPLEVALVDAPEPPSDKPVDQPDQPDDDKQAKPEPTLHPRKDLPKVKVEDKQHPDIEPPKVDAPKPEKPKEAEKQKQPEQKKEEQKPADMPVPRPMNRIAVQQHVEDKNQKDNPNAEFIADEANHVKDQTQARITATDQNDPNPTPGTSMQGPANEAGNAAVNDVAHSEDSPGASDRAPNERAGGAKATASKPASQGGDSRVVREVAPDSRKGAANGEAGGSKDKAGTKADPEREAMAASRATPENPDLVAQANGRDTAPSASEGHLARPGMQGRPKRLPPAQGKPDALDFLGLGATGTTASGINLNLTPGAAIAAVGRDQLNRERLADGERRRSLHRGSWRTVGIEKWRAAIENYNSSVKPGNQTALNTARVPFASYLNQIHNRLHPIFADSFLGSLENLPADHPLNKPDMRTNLEIVLDKDEGKIVKMGVTRSSGSTVFDVAALESVQNASPFGKPPAAIVSPDGNVYLHWEFYRNPFYACSTYFAHPFMLKASPENAPSKVPPPTTPPFGPKEDPVPGRGDLGRLDPSILRPRATP
jgi:TonB family protein